MLHVKSNHLEYELPQVSMIAIIIKKPFYCFPYKTKLLNKINSPIDFFVLSPISSFCLSLFIIPLCFISFSLYLFPSFSPIKPLSIYFCLCLFYIYVPSILSLRFLYLFSSLSLFFTLFLSVTFSIYLSH
jgi:hypothetical protein